MQSLVQEIWRSISYVQVKCHWTFCLALIFKYDSQLVYSYVWEYGIAKRDYFSDPIEAENAVTLIRYF
jgi:hypothetical protein